MHCLPVSLLDLSLAAVTQVRGGAGPGRGLLHVAAGGSGLRRRAATLERERARLVT
jgi:hypothetical protein